VSCRRTSRCSGSGRRRGIGVESQRRLGGAQTAERQGVGPTGTHMQTWIISAMLVLTVAIATVGCAGTNSSVPAAAATPPPASAVTADSERAPAAQLQGTRSPSSRPDAASDGQAMQNWAIGVYSAIRKNWALSQESPRGDLCNLATTIRVSLLEDGTISDQRIAKGSGDADFDGGCMNALSLTKRVPSPPLSSTGKVPKRIVITFHGKDLASCGPTNRRLVRPKE
jgi:hypothetical protein